MKWMAISSLVLTASLMLSVSPGDSQSPTDVLRATLGNGLRVVNDEAWAYFYSVASPHGDITAPQAVQSGSKSRRRVALLLVRVILPTNIAPIDPKIAAFSS